MLKSKIRDLRLEAKLSTDEAIEKLDISKSMFYKIEQGYRKPSTKLIKKMSVVYNCPIQRIFNSINITDSDIAV